MPPCSPITWTTKSPNPSWSMRTLSGSTSRWYLRRRTRSRRSVERSTRGSLVSAGSRKSGWPCWRIPTWSTTSSSTGSTLEKCWKKSIKMSSISIQHNHLFWPQSGNTDCQTTPQGTSSRPLPKRSIRQVRVRINTKSRGSKNCPLPILSRATFQTISRRTVWNILVKS